MIDCPDLKEVSDFHFRQLRTLRISKSHDKGIKGFVNLAAGASKYGLLFLAIEKGFKVIKFEDILNLEDDKVNKSIEENYPCTVVASDTPVALAVNCSQKVLVVCVETNSGIIANFYDVLTFSDSAAFQPFFVYNISDSGQTALLDFSWNPTAEGIYAYCLGDGTFGIHEFTGSAVKVNARRNALRATSVCWSPKGKQLVVGKDNGTFAQYKPNLIEVKSVQPPAIDENPAIVSSICWIATATFAVVYVTGDTPHLFIVSTPKDSPVTFTNFSDVCLGNNSSTNQRYFFHFEPSWGLLVCASIDSIEVAVLGDMPNWVQWDLREDGKALLPCKDGASHAIGMSVMYTSQKTIVISDTESYPPMPVIFFVTNNGLLVSFHMINSKQDAPSLVSPPLPLEKRQVLNTQVSVRVSSPNRIKSVSFAEPISQSAEYDKSQAAQPFEAPNSLSFSQTPGFCVNSSSLDKDNTQDSNNMFTGTPLQKTVDISRDSVKDSYTMAILTEIQNFSKELEDFKRLSSSLASIGSEDDMAYLKSFALSQENFQKDISEPMPCLSSDIHALKNVLLESFVIVEEANSRERRRNDHTYISMLKERALDPATAKRMQKINQYYQYLNTQLQEVSNKLDQDWIMMNQKKSVKNPHLIVSSSAVYKAIVNNQNIIHNLRKKIDYLAKKAEEKKLRNISRGGNWSKYKTSGQEDLSKLADEFLQVKLTKEDEGDLPTTKKISRKSQEFLKSYLLNSSFATVRPTSVYSPSQSRLISNRMSTADVIQDQKENSPCVSKSISPSVSSSTKNLPLNTAEVLSPPEAVQLSPSSLSFSTPDAPKFVSSVPYKPICEPVTPPELASPAEPVKTSSSVSTPIGVAPSTITFSSISQPPASTVSSVTKNLFQNGQVSVLSDASSHTVKSGMISTFGSSTNFFTKSVTKPQSSSTVTGAASAFVPTSTAAKDSSLSLSSLLSKSLTETSAVPASIVSTTFDSKPESFVLGKVSATISPLTAVQIKPLSPLSANEVKAPEKNVAFDNTTLISKNSCTSVSTALDSAVLSSSDDEPRHASSPSVISKSPLSMSSLNVPGTLFQEVTENPSTLRTSDGNVKQSEVSALPSKISNTGFMSGGKIIDSSKPSFLNTSATGSSISFSFTAKTPNLETSIANTERTNSISILPSSIQSLQPASSASTSFPEPVSSESTITTTTSTSLTTPVTANVTVTSSSVITVALVSEAARTVASTTATATSLFTSVSSMAVSSSQSNTSVSESSIPTTSPFFSQSTANSSTRVFDQQSVLGPSSEESEDSSTSNSTVAAFGLKPVFEQLSTAKSSAFGQTALGTSSFSQPSVTQSSVFGQSSSVTQSSVSSPSITTQVSTFGQSTVTQTSTFGQVTVSQSSSFGQPVTTQSSGFGQPVTTQSSGFGQPVTVQSSGFGQPVTTQSSGFGQPITTQVSGFGQPVTTQSSGFGQSVTTQATGFGQPVTTQTVGFGQSSTVSTVASGGFFSQAPAFGTSTTASSMGSSGFGFGKPAFGQSTGSFGLAKSLFGQNTQTEVASSGFGQSGDSVFGQGSFFSGLGGKPNPENASKNFFGMSNAEKSGNEGSLFGNTSSVFGSKPSAFGSGSFSSGGGSVAQSGFGAFQQSPKQGGFGAAPSFGSAPAFGSSPAFGGSPSFGTASPLAAPVFAEQQMASNFSNFASSNSPTFGSLASQSPQGFGSSPVGAGGFGAPSAGFGSPPAFGGGSSFGQTSGFGSPSSPPSNSSAFTQWRN